MDLEKRKIAYRCDITYGTNCEFALDYLRDNIAIDKNSVVQREKLKYAVLCETDNELKIPLTISRETSKNEYYYIKANSFVRRLKGEDYIVNLSSNSVTLTSRGIRKAEEDFEVDNYYDEKNSKIVSFINNALIANKLMEKDSDYIVKNGKLYMLDSENAKILKSNKRIYQALEAKEHIEISKENKIIATITLKNYYKMYDNIIRLEKDIDEYSNNMEEDDVINKKRILVYQERKKILMQDNLKEEIIKIIYSLCEQTTNDYYNHNNLTQIENILIKRFKMKDCSESSNKMQFLERLKNLTKAQYEKNEQIIGNKELRKLEKMTMLKAIDDAWIEYLEEHQEIQINTIKQNAAMDLLLAKKNFGMKKLCRVQ